ncbi:MAG: hypothetical protein AAGG68_07350 [Bacteroidota bacterium]
MSFLEERKIQAILSSDIPPIYHIHIRKTGGTTINCAFLSNFSDDHIDEVYRKIGQKFNQRIIGNNKIFVGWNTDLINTGRFSFAFSHVPLHQLKLPPHILRLTCLRDPVDRIISHYNMLHFYKVNDIRHPCMEEEGKWLGKSIIDFINLTPKRHLFCQLFMYSKEYSVNEALEELVKLDFVLFNETLDDNLKELERYINWTLPTFRRRKYGHKENISEKDRNLLREIMYPEYQLLEQLDKLRPIKN